ncbi:MAG TPA: 2Fe-2S iron-sulfur cluster-binding protein [Cyclobacteriaceae bacterium]|nr:2Fe-2S iron-sulfur cluster-binding protein [Cyclobacteriaceae bacterium]
MASIVIRNLNEKTIQNPNLSKPLLWIFLENGIDWMHACGGKGRCTTCKAVILKGAENLIPKSPAELRYERQQQLAANERLCCQAKLTGGDLEVHVPKESKLPHVKYSD